jgi:hypothetical protein
MKILIWNSDGFRDPAKHLISVSENIRGEKLDFVAILEAGRYHLVDA